MSKLTSSTAFTFPVWRRNRPVRIGKYILRPLTSSSLRPADRSNIARRPCLEVPEARRVMVGAKLEACRVFGGTAVECLRAARPERTTVRRLAEDRRLAFDHLQFRGPFAAHMGHRFEEHPRVGMLRIGEQLAHRGLFHDLAAI